MSNKRFYTGAIIGLSRAPYQSQVECRLLGWGLETKLTEPEVAKCDRVKRFLPAEDCAREIANARGWTDI